MRKFRGAALLLSAVCVLSGCGSSGGDGTKNGKTQEYASSAGVTSQPVEDEYYPYIDMQWVIGNITVNGAAIAFPAQASDLGVGMAYGEMEVFQEDGQKLYRGKVSDGTAQLDVEAYAVDGDRENMRIYELSAKNTCGIELRVAGLTFGDSYEQIVANCGEPSTSREEADGRTYVYYENCVYELLAFKLENNQITDIIVQYLPEEFR